MTIVSAITIGAKPNKGNSLRYFLYSESSLPNSDVRFWCPHASNRQSERCNLSPLDVQEPMEGPHGQNLKEEGVHCLLTPKCAGQSSTFCQGSTSAERNCPECFSIHKRKIQKKSLINIKPFQLAKVFRSLFFKLFHGRSLTQIEFFHHHESAGITTVTFCLLMQQNLRERGMSRQWSMLSLLMRLNQ